MPTTTRPTALRRSVLLLAVLAAATGVAACGGESDDTVRSCDLSDTSETCGSWGQEVTLTVDSHPDPFEWEVPIPARAAVYPGDTIDVRIEGLRPNEDVRIFSTMASYDGLRYRTDGEGELTFPVVVSGRGQTSAEHFLLAQSVPGQEMPRFTAFTLAVIGDGIDRSMLLEAVEAFGLITTPVAAD